MTPAQKDEIIRLGATAIGAGILCGCYTYFKLNQQQKIWLKHDRQWRNLFDSSMRINDILQDDDMDFEEKARKISEEQEFITITQQYMED